jgi:predicted aspartyl protease
MSSKTIFRAYFIVLFLISFAAYGNAQIVLPFTEKGDLVIIKLIINKKEAQFVFDTGASNTVLDSTVAASLNLKATGTNRNASTGGSATFQYISDQKINLTEKDEITCRRIIFTNLKSLQELIGEEFVGIIGFDIFNKYITKIDHDAKTISLFTQLSKSDTDAFTAIPFNLNNGIPIPQFEISFLINNGEKFTGPILFDSGAALTLMINTPFKEKNQLTGKIGKTIITQSQDLFKENKQEQAHIKAIQLGPYTFNDLPITLTSTKAGVSSYPYYLGILGNKIISRFNSIIDFSNKTIYLKPNKNFDLPFDFPLSGIRFKKVKNEIRLAYVVAGSDAEKLGLKRDEKVLSVDGYTGNDLEVLRKLIQQEGKTIKISVQSLDGKMKEIDLTLKKLI